MRLLYTLSRLRDRSIVLRLAHPEVRVGLALVGVASVVVLTLVVIAAGSRTGTDVSPLVWLVVAATAVTVGAALLGSRSHRAFVPLAVGIWVAWVAYRWQGASSAGPLSGPFGYRNATGAFLAQGAVAFLIAGAALRRSWSVLLALLPAGVLAATALVLSAGTVGVVVLAPTALLALAGRRGARAGVVVCALAFASVLAATVYLGLRHDPAVAPAGIAGRLADAGLTERRLDLWSDAITIVREQPGGVGHERFGEVSPTALGDSDAIFAHHEFLERGAELGWIAMVMLIGVLAWAFVRLWANPRADAVTVLAAAALAGLCAQACIDWVLHAPQVVLAAAALLGTGFAVTGETST